MPDLDENSVIAEDLMGEYYLQVIDRLHKALQPKTYLEIGVDKGDTLMLAKCPSIAIDPAFCISRMEDSQHSVLNLYRMPSDDFFAKYSPKEIFGAPIDMAFLDGMHRCEFLLRDFLNTERYCKPNSVVMLHDCLPLEVAMTRRQPEESASYWAPHRGGWWTGDVWRTALLLKRKRPDLQIITLDAMGTGLVLVTNLNPDNTSFTHDYRSHVTDMFSWDLPTIGIKNYFDEMQVLSASSLVSEADITRAFWL